jgi:hypothetical protein
MNRFRSVLIAALAGLSASVALTFMSPTASAAAIVYHANGSFECGADPGDVPGLPGFDLANSTIVIDSTGALHVTCYGSLPSGLSVPQTFVGSVLCRGDETYADTTGKIIATTGGQVTIFCKFAAP